MLITIAAGIIGVDILIGIATLITGAGETPPPRWLVLTHAAAGVIGWLLLLAGVIAGPRNLGLITAAVIMTAVVVLGFVYDAAQWRKKAPDTILMIFHEAGVVFTFIFLVAGMALL